MGLFGKKKEYEVKGGGTVEPISSNNSELQDLLSEFRQMRQGEVDGSITEEIEPVVEEETTGEEYEVSEEESESIENFLSGSESEEEVEEIEEIGDEIIDEESDEVIEEPIDEIEGNEIEVEEEVETSDEEIEEYEEVVDEEPIQEEIIEEESEIEEDEIEDEIEIEDEVEVDDEIEWNVPEDTTEEPIEVEVNISEPEEVDDEDDGVVYKPEENVQTIEEVEESPVVDAVTNEEIDKKFEEFEKRLLDKLMQQFAVMQASQPIQTQAKHTETVQALNKSDEDDIVVSTVNGNLVINGFVFTGEVVMFTPLDNIKQATWEEVVRRKGHCTYHLTTSGNGGWFIKKSNAPNPFAYIENKEEAEELAKFYAKKEKAELKIHNAKGVIEKSLSFGREKLRG